MDKRGTYAIRISGIGDGEHDFSFGLDETFFSYYKHPDIRNGEVIATVILEKRAGLLSLQFTIQGEVEVICDRCLEYFMKNISIKEQMFVRTGNCQEENPENIILIEKDDHEIEIGQYFYEFIVLALPYKKVHAADDAGNLTCNPDMLKKLEEHIISNQDRNKQIDPRWNALKEINNKKN